MSPLPCPRTLPTLTSIERRRKEDFYKLHVLQVEHQDRPAEGVRPDRPLDRRGAGQGGQSGEGGPRHQGPCRAVRLQPPGQYGGRLSSTSKLSKYSIGSK